MLYCSQSFWQLVVIQDIYDEEIDTDLLDSSERDNLTETEENIDPQNSQQAHLNWSLKIQRKVFFRFCIIDHRQREFSITKLFFYVPWKSQRNTNKKLETESELQAFVEVEPIEQPKKIGRKPNNY